MAHLDLNTERLHLRPVTGQDSEATAALMTPDIASNLTTWPPSMTPQMACDRIKLAQEALAARQSLELAILDRSTRRLFGWVSVGIFPNAEDNVSRIGFWLGGAHQGRGLMLEAAQAAIPLAASFLSIKSLEACVYPWNKAGIGLIRKLGFNPEGTVELFSPVRGRFEEALLFKQLLRSPSFQLVSQS